MKNPARKALLAAAGATVAFTLLFAPGASADAGVLAQPLYLQTDNYNGGSISGSWEFYPQGTGHGGFHVWGSICDNRADGNPVYGRGKVDGLDWSPKRTDSSSAAPCTSEGREFYNSAVSRVNRGQYQVCIDDIGPDTCGTSQWYYR